MSKKVLLLLSKGFEAYEASAFTDVVGWSWEVGKYPVDMVTTTLWPEVNSYWNLIVKPQLLFDKVNVNDFDAIAIPGGAEVAGFFEDAFDERFLNIIREFDKQGKTIASICVGALPLGKSGILQKRDATTWDLNEGSRRKQLASYGVNVLDQPLVVDKNVITLTGPATSIDVAFCLLEQLTCKESVQEVKNNMRFT